jgi:hypothetical protein
VAPALPEKLSAACHVRVELADRPAADAVRAGQRQRNKYWPAMNVEVCFKER